MGSSLEDPFLYDYLPSLMPNSFKGFSDPHLIPLLDTEAFRRILSQQAMKNASEDTDQANAILRSITSPSTIENHSHMTLFCKPKIQRSEGMEEVECRPVILKENLPPNKNGQNQQARRHGSGRVSTRRPFKINLSSFGSNVNTERDPNIMQDVDEFWAAAERRETAEAIMRRMRGEKSPEHHCSQSLKTRVRRQGSGRTASSRDFVVKPKDYAEKYALSNLEKLEEGEYPVPTFISNSDQAGETATEIGTTPISKDSLHEKLMHGGHQDYCCETVKEMPPCEKDLPLDSIQQSDMQINDGEANGIHPNAVEQKEMSHVFEAEETVNMPPKNLLSSYQNSTERAAYLLLQDYLKLDVESMHKVPVSRSGLGFSDMGKSCLNGLQRDKLNAALSLSQTESSNTINSHSFFGDEAKAMALLQQFRKQIHSAVAETPPEIFQQKAAKASSSFTSTILPSNLSEALQWPRKPQSGVQAMLQDANKPSIQSMDEEVGAETPPENVQQKAAKECSPFTSPTPPSKLSAALKWLRKHESEVQPMSQNVNNPCLRNMDEERENPCTLSPSPNTNKPSIKNMDEKMVNASTFSPSPNTYKPSIKNMDEEMPNACVFSYPPNSNAIDTSSPSKQVEDDGIRRLSFGSASELPMHDELNGEEGLNVVSGMDQFNSSSLIKQDAGDEKVETVRSNIELSNDSLAGTEKGSLFDIALPSNSHIDISEPPMKDAVSVSAQQVEESPMTLHKKNAKKLKVKKQLNIEATTGQCNVLGENQMALKLRDKERKKKKSKFQHRQSLAGAGTLWRSGVRRSTRIRSRPLEYWRGERFLYGRIHNSLSTVIGIKYSSPLPAQQKKNIVPQFKVQSYVDEQYSDLVNFAALH